VQQRQAPYAVGRHRRPGRARAQLEGGEANVAHGLRVVGGDLPDAFRAACQVLLWRKRSGILFRSRKAKIKIALSP
jgi:hypothetical protein